MTMDAATEQAGKMTKKNTRRFSFFWIPLSFFALEVFGFCLLREKGFSLHQLWPLAFGLLWALALGGILRMLTPKVSRVLYGILYFLGFIYAGAQTGYYNVFSEMMWLSDFRYASEGSDYLDVLLSFPIGWWIGLILLAVGGILILWKFPVWKKDAAMRLAGGLTAVLSLTAAFLMPQLVFLQDANIRYAGSDYGRSQSAEAAYNNMFNAHRLYEICGLHQTAVKDLYTHVIYPLTPGHAAAQEAGRKQIDDYFAQKPAHQDNEMTGLFQGKNVVLVLMESMDDWLMGPHTPTINKLMEEGINFTNFYTPVYGGIRTFNTEFCTNNGMFLSSGGGYAFDYVTNSFDNSLANTMKRQGYSPKVFHYNNPSFYSRGVFSLAMGYDEYVCYEDYVGEDKNALYDDKFLFDNQQVNDLFFREGAPTLNFIITRSAHLSYKYNEVLSNWGLKLYPQYRGLTGNEEEDCAYLKARLVDDMFARLMEELEAHDQLDNTVIIAITDHYTYGIKDLDLLYARSGVEDALELERTPCFIWAKDLEPMEMTKTLNTSDMLPTMLNLMGITPEVSYLGRDAFDESYLGWAPFSDGSWVSGGWGYNAQEKKLIPMQENAQPLSAETVETLHRSVAEFGKINNLILETDYYQDR